MLVGFFHLKKSPSLSLSVLFFSINKVKIKVGAARRFIFRFFLSRLFQALCAWASEGRG